MIGTEFVGDDINANGAIAIFELRGALTAAAAGPGSVSFDLGARYAIALAPALRLFVGPEVDLGGFFTTGGDKTGRFLLHGAGFVSLATTMLAAFGVAAYGASATIPLDVAIDRRGVTLAGSESTHHPSGKNL